MRLCVLVSLAMVAWLSACNGGSTLGSSESALSATPTSLGFGNVRVGGSAGLSTVVRAANNENRSITSISSCANFIVSDLLLTECVGGDCTTSQVGLPTSVYRTTDLELGIVESASLEVTYVYQPGSRGAHSCASLITTSGTDPTINLSGTGVAPVLTLVSGTGGFGSRRINTTSAPMSFSIRNDGDANQNLSITSVGVTSNPTDWIVSFDSSTALAPGESRAGTVSFSPKSDTNRDTTLRIVGNDPIDADEAFTVTGTGTAAKVTAPASLAILGTVVSQTRTGTITVQNPGTFPLTIASGSLTGTNAADFALVGASFPATITPGTSLTYTVQCRPSAVGVRSATLTLDTDADQNPQDPAIALSCSGTKPDISLSAGSLAFGNVAPGATAMQTITVSNATGATVSNLSVAAPSLVGTNPGDFTVAPTTAVSLAPGGSQQYTVTFGPTALGARGATLRFSSDDQETPTVDVALTGTGFAPEITLTAPSAGSIGFGDVRVATTSGAQTITIRNDGNANLAVASAALTGGTPGDFTLSGPALPASVVAGGTLSWTVSCTPTATGARTSTVRIASNDTSEPNTDVALSCNGTMGSLAVASPATPVTFADTDVGSSSAAVTITLRNTGTATVTLGPPAITGAAFAITTGLSATSLAPSATATLAIRFTPTADGSASGTLNVPYDGASNLAVGLVGNGRAALISASPPMVGFGAVVVGQAATSTITLGNTGSAVVNVTSAMVSGTGAAELAVTAPAFPTTVAAGGGTRSVTVRCAPTTVGVKTASVTFDTDADNAPQDPSIGLSCTGVKPDLSLDMTSIAYGDVPPGTPVQRTIVVSNASGTTVSNLTVAAPALSGVNATDFSVSPATGFTLAPGASRTLTVTFTPGAFNARMATLRISSDDQETPAIDVALTGTGRDRELTIVSPVAAIGFGNVKLGTSSMARTIELRNEGNADLTVSGVLSTGADAPSFVVTGPATPAVIPGGGVMMWSVACTPSSTGAKTATLQINSDDADEGMRAFAMTCTGTQASLVMTNPASQPVTFQSTRVGESSAVVTIVLQNNGTASLDVSGPPLVTPSSFAVTSTFPQGNNFTLAPGQSTQLGLRFTPTTSGTIDGTLTINWDATSLPIMLRGPGTVAVAEVSPSPDQDGDVDIGAVCIGQPRAQPFTVDNTGTGPLTFSNVTVTGEGFTVMPDQALPVTIGPGQSAGFTVTANPSAVAEITGTVTVTTDVPGAPPRTIAIAANGLMSGLGVAPATADFGTVEPGTASTSTAISLTNCDVGTLTITSVALQGPDRTEFEIIGGTRPPPNITVPATQSVQWLVVYQPIDPGASSATFHVEHSGTGGVTDVPLAGTGAGGPPADAGVDAPPGALDAGVDAPPDAGGGNPADDDDGKDSYYACAAGGGVGVGLTTFLLIGIALVVGLRGRRR